jgi:hypothetical protein
MATASDLVDHVLNRAGFDVEPAEGLDLLNERHRTMCVRAEVLRPTITVGTTVVDQEDYVLPSNVAAVKVVQVDGCEVGHDPRAADGDGCGWAVVADSSGVWSLRLAPAPDTAGLEVTAQVVIRPGDLSLTDTPLVPEEFHRALREGMMGTLYADEPEQMGVADRMEARFDTACEELRVQLRRNRRSGPARIRRVRWR